MPFRLKRRFLVPVILIASLLLPPVPARASDNNAERAVGSAVIVFLVGFYIKLNFWNIAHMSHNLKGCVVQQGNGLEITEKGSTLAWSLEGDTAGLKAGRKVRLTGSRDMNAPAPHIFTVTGIQKDLGPCK